MSDNRSGVPAGAALSLAVLVSVAGGWSECDNTSVGLVPLTDLGAGQHLGLFVGGLYLDGENATPASHVAGGIVHAASVRRRSLIGAPNPEGTYVLLSIGHSNTDRMFCASGSGDQCAELSFMGRADGHPLVDHEGLVIVNGALGGQSADKWDSPLDSNYDRIASEVLWPAGVSEAQVQAVWVHLANATPQAPLPSADADAYLLLARLGDVVRTLRMRYPMVQVVFLSDRVYGGYAESDLNPEPYAYESGFAVKWLIGAQINQMDGGDIHPIAGNLDYEAGVAPWIGWAPYLWADGLTPRGDGLTWECGDFTDDGMHVNGAGVSKVAEALMGFFLTSPMSVHWFRAGGHPGPPADLDADGTVGTQDMLILLASYGPCADEHACPADLDGDGVVDDGDLVILLQNWG
jgi:hypothetical protein